MKSTKFRFAISELKSEVKKNSYIKDFDSDPPKADCILLSIGVNK